ncbi:MAG: hypothetical protein HYT49_04025, partial [Candidatus Wildermuthbacteria bacterium]|nr:hypothetical protein [Candidatus Wildermuthbacteria bacterium]
MKEFIARSKIFALVRALSRREQFIFLGASVILLISAITYSTLYVQAKTETVAAGGGKFREGVIGQPAFVNPIFPTTEADRDISRLVFTSVAQAAESIKKSDDGKVWNIRLKENILWHDGLKLTADDVVFTLELIQNPEARSPLYAQFQGVAAERVSELEVKFVLQSPYAFFETDHLNNLRIIPKHLFHDIPAANLKLSSYGLRPVGSGPYEIVSHKTDMNGVITEVRLRANEKYFAGRPNINTFIFKFYRNSTDLIKAYNLGQVDGFGLGSAEPLTDDEITIRHETYGLRSFRYYAIFINPNLAPKELGDLKVRRALSFVVDRERIVAEVFKSRATPLYGPTSLASNQSENSRPELIQGLKFNLVVPAEPFLIKTAQIVKENWSQKGAEVSLQILPAKSIQEEILRKSNYEMILFGNITKESEDLFAFWHSSRRFYPDQNLALYQNKNVDAALEKFRQNFDSDERANILTSISNTIASDVPAIFLYTPDYTYIASPQLGGLD